MRGPIAPLLRESIEDRGGSVVSGWVNERGERASRPPSRRLSPADAMDIASLQDELQSVSPRAPLCFLLGADPPASLLRLLLDMARPDRSIYVLAPTGFGEGTRDPGLRDLARGRVLVRRTKSVPATGLLAGRGEKGILWLGNAAAATAWALRLSPLQGGALFTAFLHLFWHHASDEAFVTGKNLEFRPAKARPFDVALPREAPVMLHPATTSLPWAGASAAAGPLTAPFGGALKTLLTRPGREHHAELSARVSRGCTIVSNDLELPPLVLGGAHRKVAVGAGDWSLHIDLDDEQTAALGALVGSVAAAPRWRFHGGVTLSAVSRMPVWLESEKEALVPRDEQVLDAGRALAAELRLVPTTESPSRPPPHHLSLSARVHWTVDPPRLPAGAGDDKLVSAWNEVDRVVRERTERLKMQLDAAEEHGVSVTARLVRLATEMLGFKKGRDERRTKLERIQQRRPSEAGPDDARRIVDGLRELEQSVEELADAQRDAERKAEENLHLEEQQRRWESERAAKKDELTEKKSTLRDAREREDRLKAEHREAKDAHQKERDPHEKKDLEARMLKAKDELELARAEVQSLEARVRHLDDDLGRPFKPKPLERKDVPARPAKAPGARFVPPPATGASVNVPTEALPTIGSLRALKGQRYLVIDRWEDLATGEAEAQRLTAKLVAPQEGK